MIATTDKGGNIGSVFEGEIYSQNLKAIYHFKNILRENTNI